MNESLEPSLENIKTKAEEQEKIKQGVKEELRKMLFDMNWEAFEVDWVKIAVKYTESQEWWFKAVISSPDKAFQEKTITKQRLLSVDLDKLWITPEIARKIFQKMKELK